MSLLISIENMKIVLQLIEQLKENSEITTLSELEELILKELDEDKEIKNLLKSLTDKYVNKYVKIDSSFEKTQYSIQKISSISLRPMGDGFTFFSSGPVISKYENSYSISINNTDSFNFSLNSSNLEKEESKLSIFSEEEFINEYERAIDYINRNFKSITNNK